MAALERALGTVSREPTAEDSIQVQHYLSRAWLPRYMGDQRGRSILDGHRCDSRLAARRWR